MALCGRRSAAAGKRQLVSLLCARLLVAVRAHNIARCRSAKAGGHGKCKVARVASEGWQNSSYAGWAAFYVDGQKVDFKTRRGVNVVTLDADSQEVVSTRTYDTWLDSGQEDAALAADLWSLPHGRIVLVALMDTGMERLNPAAWAALRAVGATQAHGGFREGYALIGTKGGAAVREGRGTAHGRVEVTGRLPCKSCITAKVVRDDSIAGSIVEMYLDGEQCNLTAGPGLNMLTVDPVTQAPLRFRTYGTDPNAHAGERFAANVHGLATGTIVLIAASAKSLGALGFDGLAALRLVGAVAPGEQNFALIGSKNGWAVAEGNSSQRVVAEARLPCYLKETAPRDMPSAAFPGKSVEESNSAWPKGKQPANLEAWPRAAKGELLPCWKTRVIHDRTGGWPGHCRGLLPGHGKSLEACRSSCARRADCATWHFGEHRGCLQGVGTDCERLGKSSPHEGAQQLMHGDVRVLKPLVGLQVLGLYRLSEYSDPSINSVMRCRDWCYSNVHCQYWQYGKGGCFVEDPWHAAVAQYPLTLKGGAKRGGAFAESMLAGEYIQHFCPPKPLTLKEESKQIQHVKDATIWWNGIFLGHHWDTTETWPGGVPLPTWPEAADGSPQPCRRAQVLDAGGDATGSWSSDCLELAVGLERSQPLPTACREACAFNSSCSAWVLAGDESSGGACYHSSGRICRNALSSSEATAQWTAAERIQHGEVQVLKDISSVEIYNLHHLGRCVGVDTQTCIARCKNWCYSSVRCSYWQYGGQGCSVDALGGGAPHYALGVADAFRAADVERSLVAGEYIRHYCQSHDVVSNVFTVQQYKNAISPHPHPHKHRVQTPPPEPVQAAPTVQAPPPKPEHTTPTVHAVPTVHAAPTVRAPLAPVLATLAPPTKPWHGPRLWKPWWLFGLEEQQQPWHGTRMWKPWWLFGLLVLTACVLAFVCCFFARSTKSKQSTQRSPRVAAVQSTGARPVHAVAQRPAHAVAQRPVVQAAAQRPVHAVTQLKQTIRKDRGSARNLIFKCCDKEAAREPYAYTPCPCITDVASNKTWHTRNSKRVVVVLEKAPLEAALAREGEAAPLRTAFECLQVLVGSALFQAGRLHVYLHSAEGALVEVHPALLPPPTLGHLRHLLAGVLRKGEVHGEVSGFQPDCPLMRTVPPPVERHFPSARRCLALSPHGRQADLDQLAAAAEASRKTMVFAVSGCLGDAVREPKYGAAYAPDAVAISSLNVRSAELCKVLCHELQGRMGVFDPPDGADHAQAPLRLDVPASSEARV